MSHKIPIGHMNILKSPVGMSTFMYGLPDHVESAYETVTVYFDQEAVEKFIARFHFMEYELHKGLYKSPDTLVLGVQEYLTLIGYLNHQVTRGNFDAPLDRPTKFMKYDIVLLPVPSIMCFTWRDVIYTFGASLLEKNMAGYNADDIIVKLSENQRFRVEILEKFHTLGIRQDYELFFKMGSDMPIQERIGEKQERELQRVISNFTKRNPQQDFLFSTPYLREQVNGTRATLFYLVDVYRRKEINITIKGEEETK